MAATWQPSSPVQPSGPPARGLLLGVPFVAQTPRDYGPFARAHTFAGGPGWARGPRGNALAMLANADRTTWGVLSQLPLQGVTVVCAAKKRDATLRAASLLGVPLLSLASDWGVLCPYSDGKVYFDWGGTAEGVTRLSVAGLTFGADIWAFTAGRRGMEIWQNGVRRASNAANPTRTANNGAFGYGNYFGGTDLVDHSGLLLYGYQLAEADLRALTLDPWAPFRSRARLADMAFSEPVASAPSTIATLASHSYRRRRVG